MPPKPPPLDGFDVTLGFPLCGVQLYPDESHQNLIEDGHATLRDLRTWAIPQVCDRLNEVFSLDTGADISQDQVTLSTTTRRATDETKIQDLVRHYKRHNLVGLYVDIKMKDNGSLMPRAPRRDVPQQAGQDKKKKRKKKNKLKANQQNTVVEGESDAASPPESPSLPTQDVAQDTPPLLLTSTPGESPPALPEHDRPLALSPPSSSDPTVPVKDAARDLPPSLVSGVDVSQWMLNFEAKFLEQKQESAKLQAVISVLKEERQHESADLQAKISVLDEKRQHESAELQAKILVLEEEGEKGRRAATELQAQIAVLEEKRQHESTELQVKISVLEEEGEKGRREVTKLRAEISELEKKARREAARLQNEWDQSRAARQRDRQIAKAGREKDRQQTYQHKKEIADLRRDLRKSQKTVEMLNKDFKKTTDELKAQVRYLYQSVLTLNKMFPEMEEERRRSLCLRILLDQADEWFVEKLFPGKDYASLLVAKSTEDLTVAALLARIHNQFPGRFRNSALRLLTETSDIRWEGNTAAHEAEPQFISDAVAASKDTLSQHHSSLKELFETVYPGHPIAMYQRPVIPHIDI